MNKQKQPDYIHPLSICVSSFTFLGLTVSEESVTKNV